MTQAQLAEKVGVQPETISRLERGRRAASLSLLEKIATAFDLHLHELLHLRTGSAKEISLERLMLFAARLSAADIDVVLNVGAEVLDHARRAATAARSATSSLENLTSQVMKSPKT